MSDLRIIYPKNDGGVAQLVPALNHAINDQTGQWIPLRSLEEGLPEGFRLCTVQDIAVKDVPEGTPFEIIDASELPDRTSRNAWEWV